MSGCGGHCGCGSNCKCGGGCKMIPYLTVSEAKGAEILISGVAPLVGYTSSSASYGLDHVLRSSFNFPCSMNFANLIECRSFIGVPEKIEGGNDVSEGCKCGRCGCDPCTCK
ncbi:metallothionein-like protein type 2 [Nymphaea colorata]|nr:metallothionein-like protein type 2 isoform X1 [Nymphaea colorata]XP_049935328.1 metallothionein-like protein type 2 [Nymphaea colorata]